MSCVAVSPPVPAVNPTHAVLPPTIEGMFTATDVVNVLPDVGSVIVHVRVVPSYVICTFITSPLSRLTPDAVMSVEGTVGDAPLVYKPVECAPSPALL